MPGHFDHKSKGGEMKILGVLREIEKIQEYKMKKSEIETQMKNQKITITADYILELIQDDDTLLSAFDAFIQAATMYSEVQVEMTSDVDPAKSGELAAKYESLIIDLRNLKVKAKQINRFEDRG